MASPLLPQARVSFLYISEMLGIIKKKLQKMRIRIQNIGDKLD